jgi:hypothetical protein
LNFRTYRKLKNWRHWRNLKLNFQKIEEIDTAPFRSMQKHLFHRLRVDLKGIRAPHKHQQKAW